MTLQQLSYLTEIATSGSISRAAQRLFISQPCLSKAIRELEDEFSITIFTRTKRGVSLTPDGIVFLSHARQILEQSALLKAHYSQNVQTRAVCSISTQHYAFSVKAMAQFIKQLNSETYDFTLRETRTHEIIEDVRTQRSEIGILYLNDYNEQVLRKLIQESRLTFHPLFNAKAHVFISKNHPLAEKDIIKIPDLETFPWLTFDQGIHNSYYFFEEVLSTLPRKRVIHVSDRATLFDLLVGLNGYTFSTGVLHKDLNGEEIIARPLESNEVLRVGWLSNNQTQLSKPAKDYIKQLQIVVKDFGLIS